LKSTGEAKDFVILEEEAQAAGVRRIVATTGTFAHAARVLGEATLRKYQEAESFNDEALAEALPELRRTVANKNIRIPDLIRTQCREIIQRLDEKHMQNIKKSRKGGNQAASEIVAEAVRHLKDTGAKFFATIAPVDGNKKIMANILKEISDQVPHVALCIISASSGPKPTTTIITTAPQNFGSFSAGTWANAAVADFGGKGGGKPTNGNASLAGADKLEAILEKANGYAQTNIQ
jgi:alanyl-tRNA synthetase